MERGRLFRSPALTLGRVAPAGITAEWTLDLAPVGERQVAEGQRVELHVAVDATAGTIGADTPIAFDVLPADAAGQPAGAPILRLLGTGATAPAGVATEPRTTVARTAADGQDANAVRSAFVAEHPDDLTSQLLVIAEPGPPARTHALTWWPVAAAGRPALQFATDVGGLPAARTQAALRTAAAGTAQAGTIELELRYEGGEPMADAVLEAAFAGGVRTPVRTGEDGRATVTPPPGADPVFRLFLLSYVETAAAPGPGPGPGPRPVEEDVDTRPEVVAAFAFDSSFPSPVVHSSLRRVAAKSALAPEHLVMVFGHTDKVGSDAYNLTLSDRRAKAVLALMLDDRDMFEEIATAEGWDTRVHQSMLRGVGCNPGGIDGQAGPMTRTATTNFQREYNAGVYHQHAVVERERPVLAEDGTLGPATKAALRDAYVAVAPHVPDTAFADPKFAGCGKRHHISELDDENRRAVVALLDPELVDVSAGPPCDRYGELVGERADDRRAPPFADHQWLHEENGALHLSSATVVPDGTAARIRVVRCEERVPMPPPDSSGGGEPPALGPTLFEAPAVIQGGICHVRWPTPAPEVLEPNAWVLDHDVQIEILDAADHAEPPDGDPASGSSLLALHGTHPPMYVVEAAGSWAVAGPPGQRLNRVSVEIDEPPSGEADERLGVAALRTDGAVERVRRPRQGLVEAPEAIHAVSVALSARPRRAPCSGSALPIPPPPTPTPPPLIAIRVTDEAGVAMPGVELRVIEPGGPDTGRAETTDAQGEVTITSPVSGTYEVTSIDFELLHPADGSANRDPVRARGTPVDPFTRRPLTSTANLFVARPAHIVRCPGCDVPFRVVHKPVGGSVNVTCPDDGFNLSAIQEAAIADPGSFVASSSSDPSLSPNANIARGSTPFSTPYGMTTQWRDESRFANNDRGPYRLFGNGRAVDILGRNSWGAGPLRTGGGRVYEWHETSRASTPPPPAVYTFDVPSAEHSPLRDVFFWITIHHTADPLAAGFPALRALQTKHQTAGSESGGPAADIGYHYVIDMAGNPFEGRPLAIEGSHTERNNGGNIGIALIGDFESRLANAFSPDTPTTLQLNTLERLVDVLAGRFRINDVDGHGPRQVAATGRSTDCPGDTLEPFVAALHRARPGPP